MKFFAIKQGLQLHPSSDKDAEIFKKLPTEPIRIEYKQARNPKLLRKYFALIRFCFENLPEPYSEYLATEDDLRKELTKAAGFRRVRKDFHGNEVVEAESIAFESMSEERFQVLYSRTLDLVCRMIGVEETDIMNEILNFA